MGPYDLNQEFSPVVGISRGDQSFVVLDTEQDHDQSRYRQDRGGECRQPYAPGNSPAGVFGLFRQVRGRIVTAKFPGSEQEADHPAVCVRGLLGRTLTNPIVEGVEYKVRRAKVASSSNREPDPEHEEHCGEDEDGEAEISM